MKVGSHGGQTLEEIIARKRREFNEAGKVFWGYGSHVCHPFKQVQPFADLSIANQGELSLFMEPVLPRSQYRVPTAQREYSSDGEIWKPLPTGIKVNDSKYAFVLGQIRSVEIELGLNEFEVGTWPKLATSAEDYIDNRLSMACLVRSGLARTSTLPPKKLIRHVRFTAELKEPFAVRVR